MAAVLAVAVLPATAYGAEQGGGVPLRDAVAQLVVAAESRDGTVVKVRWALRVDEKEKAILTEMAAACPNIPIATEAGQPG